MTPQATQQRLGKRVISLVRDSQAHDTILYLLTKRARIKLTGFGSAQPVRIELTKKKTKPSFLLNCFVYGKSFTSQSPALITLQSRTGAVTRFVSSR